MEIPSFPFPADDALHIFVAAADKANLGIAIIDGAGKVWFWNHWLEEKSGLPAADACGKSLTELFPELAGSRLVSAVEATLKRGLTSLLSQSINKSPLPLFPSSSDRHARLQQAIHIIPIESESQGRFCLIQVNDVSIAVRKELLLREQAEKLHALAYVDSLTGIPNRRRLDDCLADEFRRALRNHTDLSVIMADIDHFKQYNDTYGHQAGDFCLQRIANAIRATLHRPADLIARYGGEEFAVVLPDTSLDGAIALAEDMRRHVANLAISHESSMTTGYVTLSLGIAGMPPYSGSSGEALLREADDALYRAKENGRNRIVVASARG